jgi:hypothetical protein
MRYDETFGSPVWRNNMKCLLIAAAILLTPLVAWVCLQLGS